MTKLKAGIAGAAFAVAGLGLASSASAVTINSNDTLNPDEWVANFSITMDSQTVSATYILDFVDFVPASTGVGGSTYSFSLITFNTTMTPSLASLTSWGFDTAPDTDSFALTPTIPTGWSSLAPSPSPTDPENCASTDSTCFGGTSSVGVAAGSDLSFTFDVGFTGDVTSFSMTDIFARFQSVACTAQDLIDNPDACDRIGDDEGSLKLFAEFNGRDTCGPNDPNYPTCLPGTSPVPIPAGLPLMLTAIGIGAYMRKRSRKSA